tara:strand:- start:13069 stop:13683 length:615 start_codon:yes stop_codon:yes gene_type:complete
MLSGLLSSIIPGGVKLLGKGLQKGAEWLSKGKNLQGLTGAAMMGKGMMDMNNANRLPSLESLRMPFQNSQSIIDNQMDFSNYSGAASDAALQSGNDAVKTAAMMGQSGSASNAIRNRMKTLSDNKAYENWQAGQAAMLPHQLNIDSRVSAQHQANLGDRKDYVNQRAGALYGTGQNLLQDMDFNLGGAFDRMGGLLKKLPGMPQ